MVLQDQTSFVSASFRVRLQQVGKRSAPLPSFHSRHPSVCHQSGCRSSAAVYPTASRTYQWPPPPPPPSPPPPPPPPPPRRVDLHRNSSHTPAERQSCRAGTVLRQRRRGGDGDGDGGMCPLHPAPSLMSWNFSSDTSK